MSIQYDQYLTQHKANVKKGFEWIRDNLPELVIGDYDTVGILYAMKDGEKTAINRFLAEKDGKMVEIQETEYQKRKLKAKGWEETME